MEKKALGKGLSALIPEKQNFSLDITNHTVMNLRIDEIRNNSLQPRTNYDNAKLDELKASIKEKGVLQPILVREKSGYYEVVAGERRLRAARDLALEEVPVIIRELTDQEALVIALIENIQREELNPIEEAEAYHKLVDDFNFSQEEVARSVGKDRSTITNLLRLLKLPAEIQNSIYSGMLTSGHARALLAVEDPIRQKQLFQKVVKKGLSVRELENLTREHSAHRKRASTKDHEIMALEEELQQAIGSKVEIIAKKKRGKIVIEYYSLDDLDRILRIFRK